MHSEKVGEEIKRRRKAAGMTQVELAKAAGIHEITLSKLERGRTTPDLATLRRLEAALDAVEMKGEPPSPAPAPQAPGIARRALHRNRRIPLIGHIQCGDPRIVDLGEHGTVDVPEELLPSGEATAVIVDGLSMRDEGFMPGDVVVLRRCFWSDVEDGDICAVSRFGIDAETTLKRVQFRGPPEAREVWLVPANSAFPEQQIDPDEHQMEGIAVAVLRKLRSRRKN